MGIIVRAADEMMATDKFIGRDGGDGASLLEYSWILLVLLLDTNWGILLSDLFPDKG